MVATAYVDESRRGDAYLLAAVVVPDVARSRLRRQMRQQLLLPGERTFHMATERQARRRQAINWLPRELRYFVVTTSVRKDGTEQGARRSCLHGLVRIALEGELGPQLILESRDDARDAWDRRQLRELLGRSAVVRYEHQSARAEPLLWLPDILAWAAGHQPSKHLLEGLSVRQLTERDLR